VREPAAGSSNHSSAGRIARSVLKPGTRKISIFSILTQIFFAFQKFKMLCFIFICDQLRCAKIRNQIAKILTENGKTYAQFAFLGPISENKRNFAKFLPKNTLWHIRYVSSLYLFLN
jgi:hypothetical protein